MEIVGTALSWLIVAALIVTGLLFYFGAGMASRSVTSGDLRLPRRLLLAGILLAVVLMFWPSKSPAATLPVTGATWSKQLALAVDGDTLDFTGDPVAASLSGKTGLTIVGGRFTSLTIRGGSRLTFIDTAIVATPALRHTQLLAIVNNATDLRFERLKISTTPRIDGALLGYGVSITGGERIGFYGLEVSGATKGMVASGTKGLTVHRAYVHNLRSDGFQTLGLDGAEFVDIEVGQLTPEVGDHPDGFQGNKPSRNLTIRNFRFFGSGVGDGQGIFLSDAVWPARYTNIVIENVNIANKYARCLSVDQADNLRLRNIVCTSRRPILARPGIHLRDITGLDAADTVACVQARIAVVGVEARAFTFDCPR